MPRNMLQWTEVRLECNDDCANARPPGTKRKNARLHRLYETNLWRAVPEYPPSSLRELAELLPPGREKADT
jgi:hypothetical protein